MSGQRTQSWRGGGPKYRFGDERKPIVDRPAVLMAGACWCGESHGYKHNEDGTDAVPRTHWDVLAELDVGSGA